MAKPILATLDVARNKCVSEHKQIFKQTLEYIVSTSDYESKNNCLKAIETLIDLGFRATKECGAISDIQTYQKYLRSYIYHSACFEKQKQSLALECDDHISKIAQSLSDMQQLAIASFERLGYPSYCRDFAYAMEILLGYIGGDANLLSNVAGLVLGL